jgi:tungstate transport system substrate-binding protein
MINKKILVCILGLLISSYSWAENILRVSTTTSTENSGLLTVLNPPFEKKFAVRLDVIAVGTGKALRLGENGDVDVVFVHAPKAELAFVDDGFGVDRKPVMHNDFVFIGPKSDPARLKSSKHVQQLLHKIKAAQALFISRGDDSGTHKKEKQLWLAAEIKPAGNWYISTGQGMGAVLRIADDKQAYTLTDRGTFIAYQDKIDLQIVFAGDKALYNPYHIMAVNPERHPHVQYELATQYINFVTGPEGQQIIKNYKKGRQQLFYPDVINDSELQVK